MRNEHDTRRSWAWPLALALATGMAACGGGDAGKEGADAASDAAGNGDSSDAGALPAADPAPDYDPLQPSWCALPWPSARYLAADAATATGRRLSFGPTSLPANVQGFHVLPERFARMDGYGVGTALIVHFPGIDIGTMADEDDLQPSLAADAPIALWDAGPAKGPAQALKRVPYWVELDRTAGDPAKQALFIRPGVLLREGRRYVVAMRGLETETGDAIAASPAFAALRDGQSAGTYLAARQAWFDAVAKDIESAGWKRAELVLAWDFVTASHEALHGDLVHVRDQAMQIVGELGAEITVTQLTTFTKAEDAHMAAWVAGSMTVPDFTEPFDVGARMGAARIGKEKGAQLRRDTSGKPVAKGTRTAPFWVVIPHTALDGTPHGLVQYGHGLLGKGDQVKGSFNRKIAFDHKLIFFGCSWTGMAEEDEAPITQMVFEFSDFHMIPERLHQGMAEALLLGRAMRERFAKLAPIAALGVQVDKKQFFYSGISQGGIYGATYMALSQDVTRGHLGVPGQNYSLLLHRSVDFAPFFVVMIAAYPESIDRALLLMAGQTLWDQVDPSSLYRHLEVEPMANTPKHQVLLASAKGDHQVALLANEIVARSDVGVALLPGYGKKVWGVDAVTYPHKGSGLVNYDFGNAWPKPGNWPDDTKIQGAACGPGGMCLAKGLCAKGASGAACELGDPHGKPRKLDHHNDQMVHFLRTGEVKDVCGGDGCTPF